MEWVHFLGLSQTRTTTTDTIHTSLVWGWDIKIIIDMHSHSLVYNVLLDETKFDSGSVSCCDSDDYKLYNYYIITSFGNAGEVERGREKQEEVLFLLAGGSRTYLR